MSATLRVHPDRYEQAKTHPAVLERAIYETVTIVQDKWMPLEDSDGKPILGWWVPAQPLRFPEIKPHTFSVLGYDGEIQWPKQEIDKDMLSKSE